MLEIRREATGVAETLKRLDPQRVGRAQLRWFREGTELARRELRARAPRIVAAKIKIKMDPMVPPGWALVGSTHPLALVFEAGTGARGAPGFRHKAKHFPRVTGRGGLMETTGLPRARAFAVAQAIADAGGLAPRPFVAPTAEAVRPQLIGLAERIVAEELK